MNRTMNVTLGLVALLCVSLTSHAQHSEDQTVDTKGRERAPEVYSTLKQLKTQLDGFGDDVTQKGEDKKFPFKAMSILLDSVKGQREALEEFCRASGFESSEEFANFEDEYLDAISKIFTDAKITIDNTGKKEFGPEVEDRLVVLTKFIKEFLKEKALQMGVEFDKLPKEDRDLHRFVSLVETHLGMTETVEALKLEAEEFDPIFASLKGTDKAKHCRYEAPVSEDDNGDAEDDEDGKGNTVKDDDDSNSKKTNKEGNAGAVFSNVNGGTGSDGNTEGGNTTGGNPFEAMVSSVHDAIDSLRTQVADRLAAQREALEDKLAEQEDAAAQIAELQRQQAEAAAQFAQAQNDNNSDDLLGALLANANRDNGNDRAAVSAQPQQQQPFFPPQVSTPSTGGQQQQQPPIDPLAQAGAPPTPPSPQMFGLGNNNGQEKAQPIAFPVPAPVTRNVAPPAASNPLQDQALISARNALKANDEYIQALQRMSNPFGLGMGMGINPYQQQQGVPNFANRLASAGQQFGFPGNGFSQPGLPGQVPVSNTPPFRVNGTANTGTAGALQVQGARTSVLPPGITAP